MAFQDDKSRFYIILCVTAGSLCLQGFSSRQARGAPPAIENAAIAVSLDPADMTLSVLDKRTGHRWQQRAGTGGKPAHVRHGPGLETTWHDASLGMDIWMTIELDADKPEWEAQKGRFGCVRRLRYVFFDEGGHVAMCKRYRDCARRAGLLKTLEQKRKENPNVGRQMQKIWDEVPERVAKYQLGCAYRLPPMFMFTKQYRDQNKSRFVRSYKDVCTVARAVGYSEMTDHRFLTPDRSVQQTHFANGVVVTVNFGNKPFQLPDGTEIAAMNHHVAGM